MKSIAVSNPIFAAVARGESAVADGPPLTLQATTSVAPFQLTQAVKCPATSAGLTTTAISLWGGLPTQSNRKVL